MASLDIKRDTFLVNDHSLEEALSVYNFRPNTLETRMGMQNVVNYFNDMDEAMNGVFSLIREISFDENGTYEITYKDRKNEI